MYNGNHTQRKGVNEMKKYTVIIDQVNGGNKSIDTNDHDHAEHIAKRYERKATTLFVEIVKN